MYPQYNNNKKITSILLGSLHQTLPATGPTPAIGMDGGTQIYHNSWASNSKPRMLVKKRTNLQD
jgi:hypothetical protein